MLPGPKTRPRAVVAHWFCAKRRRPDLTNLRRFAFVLGAMLDAVRKHALVIVVAILFATYRLSRLEGERGRRGVGIEQDFETVVGFLHQNLDTKYRVLRVASSPNAVKKLHAMVINGGFAIPHVEAEVFVDQQLALDQRKPRRTDQQPSPPVRFRVYDTEAMTPIAETLKQRNLIATYEQGYRPS